MPNKPTALDLINEVQKMPIKYYLMDTIQDKVELVFTSEDISSNTCKWEYVRNCVSKESYAYRIYKPTRINLASIVQGSQL